MGWALFRLDPSTHTIYLSAVEFPASPVGAAAWQQPKPDSFVLVVVTRGQKQKSWSLNEQSRRKGTANHDDPIMVSAAARCTGRGLRPI
jgi:hypothetical protein